MNRRSFLGAVGVGAAGCAGSQVQVGATGGTGAGGQGWQVGVSIGITIARDALPVARSVVDASSIPVATKASIDRGIQVASDAIALASTGWDAFVRTSSTRNQCTVSADIDDAVNALLEAYIMIRDAGVQVPAQVSGAIQGLGLLADMLFPGCGSSPSPSPSPSPTARMAMHATGAFSVSRRVQHVLGGGQ